MREEEIAARAHWSAIRASSMTGAETWEELPIRSRERLVEAQRQALDAVRQAAKVDG